MSRYLLWPLQVLYLGLVLAFPAFSQVSRPLIPFHAVEKKEVQAGLRNIAEDYTVFRQVAPAPFEGTQEQYDFLMDHLHITAAVIRAFHLGAQVVEPLGPGRVKGNDGDGLTGDLTLVYRDLRKRVFFGRGRFDGFLFFNLAGRAVIVADQVPEGPGRRSLHIALYVKLDNRFLAVTTHLFSPLFGGSLERRITQFLIATATASRFIREDPQGVLKKVEAALRPEEREAYLRLFLPRAAGVEKVQ